jgi:tetratricopeptide (TPR) repeat protein
MNVLLLLCLMTGPDPAQLWTEGSQAYAEGRFSDARGCFEALLELGIDNEALQYNLGNIWFREGRIGLAMLHYSRAQRWDPLNGDLQENMALAMQQRKDPPIEEERADPFRRFKALLLLLPLALLWWSSAFFFTLAGLSAAFAILRGRLGRMPGYGLVLSALLGMGFGFWCHAQHIHLTRRDQAVVIETVADVHAGPSRKETISFTIHEGMRCQILDVSGDWYRIRLANGYNGWLPKSRIAAI